MSKSKIEIPADKLVLYNNVVGNNPDIERKGKTTPYTSINGHMFSFFIQKWNYGITSF